MDIVTFQEKIVRNPHFIFNYFSHIWKYIPGFPQKSINRCTIKQTNFKSSSQDTYLKKMANLFTFSSFSPIADLDRTSSENEIESDDDQYEDDFSRTHLTIRYCEFMSNEFQNSHHQRNSENFDDLIEMDVSSIFSSNENFDEISNDSIHRNEHSNFINVEYDNNSESSSSLSTISLSSTNMSDNNSCNSMSIESINDSFSSLSGEDSSISTTSDISTSTISTSSIISTSSSSTSSNISSSSSSTNSSFETESLYVDSYEDDIIFIGDPLQSQQQRCEICNSDLANTSTRHRTGSDTEQRTPVQENVHEETTGAGKSNGISCGVCFEGWNEIMNNPNRHFVTIDCGHIFCNSCIYKLRSSQCPKCRHTFKEHKRLYF